MKRLIFDLKFLTGVIFCYLGLVLVVFGLFTNKTTEFFPYNINFWWGSVTFLFGLAFFIAAFITRTKSEASQTS
ncbi:hypothetical protein J15TS10_23670 [Paenibacillus woosongensis]|uniref:DUF3955 domain-containing protein n=1 Tax=Paenibacillus woosongensis TaxID=307580 RepID=A0ABQ4MRK6_9BACL|nr:hypothetical protein J15TS10_23670 [Paenibacillus woosongensis]